MLPSLWGSIRKTLPANAIRDNFPADEHDAIQPESTPPDILQAISYAANQDVREPGESDFAPGPSLSDPEDSHPAQTREMPSVSIEDIHRLLFVLFKALV